MKKTVFILTLLLIAFNIFSFTLGEEIFLKGKLGDSHKRFTELKTEQQEYILILPPHVIFGLAENQEVEIEGKLVSQDQADRPLPGAFFNDEREYVMVSKITANGKTLDLEEEFYSKRKRGKRGGQGRRGQGPRAGKNCPCWGPAPDSEGDNSNK